MSGETYVIASRDDIARRRRATLLAGLMLMTGVVTPTADRNKDRDQRTDADVEERKAKQAAKLARRAARMKR